MSFQMPSQRQEQQRSKILEDLQKKQQLLKQQQSQQSSHSTASQSQPQPVGPQSITSSSSSLGQSLTDKQSVENTLGSQPSQTQTPALSLSTSQQRAALQHAHNNSFGFYITQDSSFGNLILPVLPRF